MRVYNSFDSIVYIERIHHILISKVSSPDQKQEHAIKAVKHLLDIGFTKSPYWKEFLLASGLKDVKEREVPAEGAELAVQKAIAHRYADSISILESLESCPAQYYQQLEKIVHLLILAEDFKGLEELDYRLNAIPINHDKLKAEELNALRKLRLVICCSFYMKASYFNCCKSFFKLINNDPGVLDLLRMEDQEQFMSKEEIVLMVTISTVLAIPFDNYDDFLYVQKLGQYGEVFTQLIECLNLLINTCFGKLLEIWHIQFDYNCKQSIFLNQNWSTAQNIIRSKIYFFYLRISKKVEVSYLSRTLGIDATLLRKEIKRLIAASKLNFEFDGDLIYYKRRHYLQAVIPKLQDNQALLNMKLEEHRIKNQQLKDIVQEIIVRNSEPKAKNLTNETQASEEQQSGAFNASDNMDMNMDMDEINETSDIEHASFEIG